MGISEADYIASLDLIHEAALEPAAWVKVLRQLAKLTDCVAGGLTVENLRTGERWPIAHFSFDEHHVETGLGYRLPLNPFSRNVAMKPDFPVANGSAAASNAGFRNVGFYNACAGAQNQNRPLTLLLHREEPFYCRLTLVRPDGSGETSARDRSVLNRLEPHLVHAMRVSFKLESLRQRISAREATLSRISVAVLLLDSRMLVVFANPAGERLLVSRSPLTMVRGALVAQTARSNQLLQQAIVEVTSQKGVAGAEVSIERERRRPLLATVLPVRSENSFVPLVGKAACCAVFVSDPDSDQASRAAAFARLYDLTPTEGRLLDSILWGAGLMQAAEHIGIGIATARTHLMHIFSKTGTGRQGELINLVMASTPPLNSTRPSEY